MPVVGLEFNFKKYEILRRITESNEFTYQPP
jgi:hypothetical protein